MTLERPRSGLAGALASVKRRAAPRRPPGMRTYVRCPRSRSSRSTARDRLHELPVHAAAQPVAAGRCGHVPLRAAQRALCARAPAGRRGRPRRRPASCGARRARWPSPSGTRSARCSMSPLERADYVVFDLETTGTRAGVSRIVEVGAVRHERRSRTAARISGWSTRACLVPPADHRDHRASPSTTCAGGRASSRVLDEFLRFSAGAVLVAHNARFDIGFVDAELAPPARRAAGGAGDRHRRPRPAPARRPAAAHEPGLRWPSGSTPRCARATGRCPTPRPRPRCCVRLLGLAQERGAATVGEVIGLCAPGTGGVRHAGAASPPACPTGPGVYLFRDARDAGALRRQGDRPARPGALVLLGPGAAGAGRAGGRGDDAHRDAAARLGVRGGAARARADRAAAPACQLARAGADRGMLPHAHPGRAGAAAAGHVAARARAGTVTAGPLRSRAQAEAAAAAARATLRAARLPAAPARSTTARAWRASSARAMRRAGAASGSTATRTRSRRRALWLEHPAGGAPAGAPRRTRMRRLSDRAPLRGGRRRARPARRASQRRPRASSGCGAPAAAHGVLLAPDTDDRFVQAFACAGGRVVARRRLPRAGDGRLEAEPLLAALAHGLRRATRAVLADGRRAGPDRLDGARPARPRPSRGGGRRRDAWPARLPGSSGCGERYPYGRELRRPPRGSGRAHAAAPSASASIPASSSCRRR